VFMIYVEIYMFKISCKIIQTPNRLFCIKSYVVDVKVDELT